MSLMTPFKKCVRPLAAATLRECCSVAQQSCTPQAGEFAKWGLAAAAGLAAAGLVGGRALVQSETAATPPWKTRAEDPAPAEMPSVKTGLKNGCESKRERTPILPVQSILCWPPNDAVISGKDRTSVAIEGLAWSGGGRGICRVEVSLDDGASFHAADLVKDMHPDRQSSEAGQDQHCSWVHFNKRLQLAADVQEQLRNGEKVEVHVCAKAIDEDCNTQPAMMHKAWNISGICVNQWPRATFTLDPTLPRTYSRA